MSFAILTTALLNRRENSQIYANRAREASWTTIQRGFRNFSSWKLFQPPFLPFTANPLNLLHEFDCVITPAIPTSSALSSYPFDEQVPFSTQVQGVALLSPTLLPVFKTHREIYLSCFDIITQFLTFSIFFK